MIWQLQGCSARRGQRLIRPLRGQGSSGFSLFELLIAISLIALTCIILFGVQADNIDRAAEARFHSLAAMLAQKKLVEFNLQNFADLTDASGDFGPAYPDIAWSSQVRLLTAEESGLAGSSGWLKLVELTLWDNSGRPFVYTVRTVLLRKIEAVL